MLSEKKKKNLPVGITILVLQFCFYSCNFQVPKGLEDLGLLLNFQKFAIATAVSEGNITVTGTVKDASGTAISGGILEISRSTSANTLSRATADTKVYADTSGKFSMNIYAGSFSIKVSRSDGALVGSFALKVTNATSTPEVSSATGLQVTGIAAAPVGSGGTTGGTTTPTPVAFLSIPNGTPSSILEGNSSTIGAIMTGSVTQSYTVTITSSNPSAISVSPSSIEVTPTNFSINKQITLTALQDENLVSENVKITLSSEGLNQLEFTLTTTDDDTQNIVLAGVNSLTQNNSGSITVKLTKEPPSNTTVNLVSSLPSALTLSTSSLTFTPANYSLPQTVTVNALQDANQDSETVTITALAVGITDSIWNVLCIDDPTIVFTGGSSVAEGGLMTLSITLSGNPGVDRTVNFVSGKTSSLTVSPSSMSFTPSSFNASQTLTVTGVEDTNVISEAVIITASGTGLVSSTKTVNTVDNDTMNIVLGGATVVVEGSTATLSVALTHDPSVDFVVSISSGDSTIISVSPLSLTFNSTNYSTAQNVTLSAPVDGNQTSESVVITASASGVTSQTRSVQAFDVNPPTFVSVTPGLLKTGQTVQSLSGDDGSYQKGSARTFTAGGVTGLLFQRCNRGQTPPSCTGTPTVSTYSDAKSYCDTLSLAGKVWRLPTIKELSYLWDYSKSSFDNTAFPNAVLNSTLPYLTLWSSTDYILSTNYDWGFRISSDVGNSSYGGNTFGNINSGTARCVTGTDVSSNTFTDNFDSTVTDSSTGLIWQQTPSFSGIWSEAINYCNTLSLGGKTWRLPNINEMRSIVNYSNDPPINATFFPNTQKSFWWTSTTAAHDSTRAWTFNFADGQTGYNSKTSLTGNARCVTGP